MEPIVNCHLQQIFAIRVLLVNIRIKKKHLVAKNVQLAIGKTNMVNRVVINVLLANIKTKLVNLVAQFVPLVIGRTKQPRYFVNNVLLTKSNPTLGVRIVFVPLVIGRTIQVVNRINVVKDFTVILLSCSLRVKHGE